MPDERAPGIRLLLEVPITFAVGDEVTHAPMVEGMVNAVPTRLILDTGSTDHILTTELVARAALHAVPGEAGTDSTGSSIPSWTVDRARVGIGPRHFALSNLVAIVGPAPFAGWGIGGFLSPQHLQAGAWAVVDLADARFALVSGDEKGVSAWLAVRHPDLVRVRLDRAPGDATILVAGGIEPHPPVTTMLDTGGKRTEFTAAAVPGLGGGQRLPSGRGVGGTESFAADAGPGVLRIGPARVRVPSLLVREQKGNAPGVVGMDLLRGTVLAVRGDPQAPVLWLVPASTLA